MGRGATAATFKRSNLLSECLAPFPDGQGDTGPDESFTQSHSVETGTGTARSQPLQRQL